VPVSIGLDDGHNFYFGMDALTQLLKVFRERLKIYLCPGRTAGERLKVSRDLCNFPCVV
jgi:hypothetical protein